MKLGSSIRRRRDRDAVGPGAIVKRFLLGLLLVALGAGGGYLLATELLFPAPEPPEELIAVPALQGLERDSALARIRERGLVPGPVDSLRHPTLPEGAVVGQTPLPDQRALPGDTVLLTVSLGPELRSVPDVHRVRGDRARTVLEATGFRVAVDSVESPRPRGTVMAVSPDPGTPLQLPGEVRLTVSLGPPQVRMPILLGMGQDRAIATLDSLGLVVSEVDTRFRFGLDQGTVVEQEPAAGAMVDRGSAVRLVVGRRGG